MKNVSNHAFNVQIYILFNNQLTYTSLTLANYLNPYNPHYLPYPLLPTPPFGR